MRQQSAAAAPISCMMRSRKIDGGCQSEKVQNNERFIAASSSLNHLRSLLGLSDLSAHSSQCCDA
jgi:hypothetical protein